MAHKKQNFVELGRKGGFRRAIALSSERRSEIARLGALARAETFKKKLSTDTA